MHTYSWSLLTHCVSIALLRLCAWSFFLINGLCTGWGAPHVWGEKWVEMNQKLGIGASKHESQRFLFSETVWQWKRGTLNSLQFLRVTEHHYIPLSVCVFMHGLLPSCPRQRCVMTMQLGNAGSTAECSLTASCSQSHYSYRRRRQHVHEMCVRVSSPL